LKPQETKGLVMNIVPHLFGKNSVSQASEEFYIGQHKIPKGYVNLTEMCKAGNKKLAGFTRSKRYEAYIACVASDTQICISQLTVEIRGNTASHKIDEQGTWGHHLIALSLASWISPEFELRANKVLWGVINGDTMALTEESEEAHQKLQESWEKIRSVGKATRRTMTDASKDWYERNPNGSIRSLGAMIAQTTNLIYQRLWGMDALQLEAYLGCGRHESRDFLSESDIRLLDRAEANVAELIDDDNLKPVDAAKIAQIRPAKRPPQHK
jgi:hypothetical protein